MTTVYFIRHAHPDFNVHDDRSRPLTEKGRQDCALVTEFLRDKEISAVLSSPFIRAIDTVRPFAESIGAEIEIIDDFRERKVADEWIVPFKEFTEKQWEDFSYKLPGGECLREVEARNIAALEKVLAKHRGKNIAIGTHGTALSVIINFFDNTYGYAGFCAMKRIFPWVVKMEFDENGCAGMEKIDLFNQSPPLDYSECVVRTAPLGLLKAYKYTVTFARYKNKWLYCRAKERDAFETAGGRIEKGETILEAAKRELFEETGAVKYDIEPVFDYSVHYPNIYSNGQVFLAYIHELGEMPGFEMAEIGLFDTIPDKMRFPKILPVLYDEVQTWMNNRTALGELQDIYDSERKPTGRTYRRGEQLPPGDYSLVVHVWLQNSSGEFLITQRSPYKGFPNAWECPGGGVVAGDDSLTAAIKEMKEETGLDLKPENGKMIFTRKGKSAFFDTWLFKQDFDLNDVVLQEGETVDAKCATKEEILDLVRNNKFKPSAHVEELFDCIGN